MNLVCGAVVSDPSASQTQRLSSFLLVLSKRRRLMTEACTLAADASSALPVSLLGPFGQ